MSWVGQNLPRLQHLQSLNACSSCAACSDFWLSRLCGDSDACLPSTASVFPCLQPSELHSHIRQQCVACQVTARSQPRDVVNPAAPRDARKRRRTKISNTQQRVTNYVLWVGRWVATSAPRATRIPNTAFPTHFCLATCGAVSESPPSTTESRLPQDAPPGGMRAPNKLPAHTPTQKRGGGGGG